MNMIACLTQYLVHYFFSLHGLIPPSRVMLFLYLVNFFCRHLIQSFVVVPFKQDKIATLTHKNNLLWIKQHTHKKKNWAPPASISCVLVPYKLLHLNKIYLSTHIHSCSCYYNNLSNEKSELKGYGRPSIKLTNLNGGVACSSIWRINCKQAKTEIIIMKKKYKKNFALSTTITNV